MRDRRLVVQAVVFVLAAAFRPLLAQGAPLAVPSAFVRVAHSAVCCRSPLSGDLVSLDGDSLTIAPRMRGSSNARATLARKSIASLDVGVRVGQRKAAGAPRGLIIGALAGALVGYVAGSADGSGYGAYGAVFVGAGGAVLGLLVGTVYGSTQTHYEWIPVQPAIDRR